MDFPDIILGRILMWTRIKDKLDEPEIQYWLSLIVPMLIIGILWALTPTSKP